MENTFRKAKKKNPKKAFPKAKREDKASIRLNKFLSNAGLCSRREADQQIAMGLVIVNGKIITEMGHQVQPRDVVKYDGQTVQSEALVYLLLNKPKGFVATAQGGSIKKSVQELIVSGVSSKVPPVGEMGRPTTGLLLFTNDAALRKRLSKSVKIPMLYQLILDKNMAIKDMEALKKGVRLQGKPFKVNTISHVKNKNKNEIGVQVHSIGPATLTKMFLKLGYKITGLDRVLYGSFSKKDLPRGRWRTLSATEVNFLKMM